MRRVGILLMVVALAVASQSCVLEVPGFTPQYSVRISSTIGGAVTDPGEGLFRYPVGTVVNLVAEPERGYRFVRWVSNSGSIADVNDPTTTITMTTNYCFVIANFDD